MFGAVHFAEPLWFNGRPTSPVDLRRGDEAEGIASRGYRRARVEKAGKGQGKGTVWLHGASGACIRCLHAERVAIWRDGRRTYKAASRVRTGDFLVRLIGGHLTVDPVMATRTIEESVPAIYLTLPPISLISEEGFLCRPC